MATARKPKMVVNVVNWTPEVTKVPTSVMPEMALAPDMRGVCKRGGNLVITSKPTKRANTKMVRAGYEDLHQEFLLSSLAGVEAG